MEEITVKLFASLRNFAEKGSLGLIEMSVNEGSEIESIVSALGIPKARVKMIMKNGRVAAFGDVVKGGDRVALFPPEVAFNLYVALNFREDLR
jgi:molybdopterin converting factor small subunit